MGLRLFRLHRQLGTALGAILLGYALWHLTHHRIMDGFVLLAIADVYTLVLQYVLREDGGFEYEPKS